MENQALHRVFNVFLLGLAAECYLFIVQRFYTASTVSSLLLWDRILRWGVWLGLVMLVAGLVVAVVKRNQAKLRTAMTWVAGIGAFLAVSGWVITRFFDQNRGITAMCIAVPVLTAAGAGVIPVPARVLRHYRDPDRVSLLRVGLRQRSVRYVAVPVIVCAVLVVIALVVPGRPDPPGPDRGRQAGRPAGVHPPSATTGCSTPPAPRGPCPSW